SSAPSRPPSGLGPPDPGCNNHKRDRIAGVDLLVRWSERLHWHGTDLAAVAGAAGWQTSPRRTVGLARSVYGHLPAGTPLEGGLRLSAEARVQLPRRGEPARALKDWR